MLVVTRPRPPCSSGSVAAKDLAEALTVFKEISRRISELKLIVTGKVTNTMIAPLRKVCRRLDVEDKVVFTGLYRERRDLKLSLKLS